MAKQLSIEVWSDIACPWCYIGKRRLEAALDEFPQRDRVQVIWRAFELDPSAPAVRDIGQSYAERLAKKYGTGVAEAGGMLKRMVDTAAAEGLDFDFDQIRPGNTFLAHRLLHLARERGCQDAVKERFLSAYMTEGEKIGDPDTLVRLATQAGLEHDEVIGLVSSDLYADAVRADQQEARQIGIDGVPFFLLGRRYAVAGAQPAELLLRALNKTWEELPEAFEAFSTASEEQTEGALCGPEGCG
ncbi:MAG: 2-hydroxychromene-2-carboxylate isomerase/DsbA-like thioredoxin domain protein [Myxococcaceae bacterium]|nr:2-hydroxychromene-2-carboxylate isomerase/DsbA-like thioredoxin domain protein [Myxococcaceae bacterium]